MMATYFISTGYSNLSIPNYYKNLAQELLNRGHIVILIFDGQVKEALDIIGNPKQYTWPSRRPTGFKDALFLYKLIKQYKPDYMLANFGSVNLMMLMGWLTGVSHRIAWYHTLTEQIAIDFPSQRFKTFKMLRKKFVYSLCTGIIPVSHYAKKDIIQVYGIPDRKCHVLHNLLSETLADKKYSKEKNKIVCVGRLHKSKGQDILIRAVATIVPKIPNIKVVFVGAGSEEQNYKDLAYSLGILSNCIFAGTKEMEEVLESMGASQICIVPSYIDNFPTVSLEAQSVGTPVIVSSSGGMPETMRDGETGFVVPYNKANLLAEKIERILTDEALAKKLSDNARIFFINNFSYRKLSEYCQYFESI